tara:strand:+ start:251 stop:661 length:411 start_codon:yes stop_codon:yes gene_type:complete
MKKLLLQSTAVLSFVVSSFPVNAELMALECKYEYGGSDSIKTISYIFDKNEGKSADIKHPSEGDVGGDVTWNPSSILIKYSYLFYGTEVKNTDKINRSNLSYIMQEESYKDGMLAYTFRYPGKCQVSDIPETENIF